MRFPKRALRWIPALGMVLVFGLVLAAWPSPAQARVLERTSTTVVAGDPDDTLGFMDAQGGSGGGEGIESLEDTQIDLTPNRNLAPTVFDYFGTSYMLLLQGTMVLPDFQFTNPGISTWINVRLYQGVYFQ